MDLDGNIKHRFNCYGNYSYFRGGANFVTPGRPTFVAVNSVERKIHVSVADCRVVSCFTFEGKFVSKYIPDETVTPAGLVVDPENMSM